MKLAPLIVGLGAGALIILPDPNPITLCLGIFAFWIITPLVNSMMKEHN